MNIKCIDVLYILYTPVYFLSIISTSKKMINYLCSMECFIYMIVIFMLVQFFIELLIYFSDSNADFGKANVSINIKLELFAHILHINV